MGLHGTLVIPKNIQNVLPWATPGSEQRKRCPTCEQKQGVAGTPGPSSELHALSWLAWGGAGLQMEACGPNPSCLLTLACELSMIL